MDFSISDLIQQYLTFQRENDFELILKTFLPLIKKYAKKLYYLDYEDSIQELSIELFLCLPKIKNLSCDYICLAYINKVIKHKFCKLYSLSKEKQDILEDFSTYQETPYNEISYENVDFYMDLKQSMKAKTKMEQDIILYLLLGYADNEISYILKVSRQYINRIKKNILN